MILHHMQGHGARKIAGVSQDFFEVLLEFVLTAVFNPKLEDDLARHSFSPLGSTLFQPAHLAHARVCILAFLGKVGH